MKYISIILAVVVISCKDSSTNTNNHSTDQIYLEFEQINYAWGYCYQGMMIDRDGKMYSYNPAKDTIGVLYNENNYYTETELQSKYQHYRTYYRNVNQDTLLWCYELANNVTPNTLSDTSMAGCDMGSFIYTVYIYRTDSCKYQKIVLRQDGDVVFYNRSENAVALVTWMKKLFLK